MIWGHHIKGLSAWSAESKEKHPDCMTGYCSEDSSNSPR
jgi:hypothetical protein